MLSKVKKPRKYLGLVVGMGIFISIVFIIFYVNRNEIINENKIRINIVINYLDKTLSQNENIPQVSPHLLRQKAIQIPSIKSTNWFLWNRNWTQWHF